MEERFDMEIDAEKKTLAVIILTIITMIAEIAFGYFTHSMALFADGWHMGTHALALSLTFFTYVLIRKFANSKDFVFGTGKFGILSGFASSLLLGVTGIFIISESAERIFNPLDIGVNEAIIVALAGLIVNASCIFIMGEHGICVCSHECKNPHHHEDFNYKAAYMHIVADAMTSVFAIIALLAAKYLNLTILDPIVGLVGGFIICKWAYSLISKTGTILLDTESKHIKKEILDYFDNKINFSELHIWQTSEENFALVCKIESNENIQELKTQLSQFADFSLINIEIE